MSDIDNVDYVNDNVNNIREWLKKQQHLPQKIEDNMILRFLRCTNNSVERSKTLMDLFFTLRSQWPEVFSNRDPNLKELQEIFDILDLVPLPKLLDNKYKLFIYRLNNNNPEKYDHANSLKAFFMVADLRILFDNESTSGEIPIFDMSNITLRHLTKLSLPLVKKYMTYTQEAHPVNLKQIHVVNVAPFLDRCLMLVKPFMNKEVAQALHFHQPQSKTLFNFIPEELLPEDYGGKLQKVVTLKEEWMRKIKINRDVFLDDCRWKVDESKRSETGYRNDDVCSLDGSFRTLNID